MRTTRSRSSRGFRPPRPSPRALGRANDQKVEPVGRARGTGVGKALMRLAVARMTALFAGVPIVLVAQAHLQKFYAEFGFVVFGEPYDEDGIPHIDMRRG